jgi:hypothetical protein
LLTPLEAINFSFFGYTYPLSSTARLMITASPPVQF